MHNSPGDRKSSTVACGNAFANIVHYLGKTSIHQPCLSTSKQIPHQSEHSSTSTDFFPAVESDILIPLEPLFTYHVDMNENHFSVLSDPLVSTDS